MPPLSSPLRLSAPWSPSPRRENSSGGRGVTSPPLPEQFRLFAQGAARDGDSTYDVICRGIADDPDILALISEAPEHQRRPHLLLASVHFLLLGGVAHPLAAHYATVRWLLDGGSAPDSEGPVAVAGDDIVDDFKDFCLTHRSQLLELIAGRNTQTNEVGRCAALLPAFSVIAAGYPDGQPLSLLDLGTSAGLNLLFDSYAYTYRARADGTTRQAGRESSEVQLHCTVRTDLDGLPRLFLPPIAGRTGIDASPIDPRSDHGADWLLACLWPDNLDRFVRLRAALEVARTTPRPPVLHQGDIVDDLPAVVAGLDGDSPLVLFHSWVAAYLSPERQSRLVEVVRDQARGRRLHYLYAEASVETPGLPTPPSPSPGPTSHLTTALVHLDLTTEGAEPVRLADMHHHGNWLRWWA
jgi:hypothetical protein